jgi:hypothetical protein
MPYIGKFETGIFLDKTVKYIVLLGETEEETARALAAMKEHQIAYAPLEQRTLASGDYRIYLETVQLIGH